MYIYIYVSMYVCIYIYICMYVYIYTPYTIEHIPYTVPPTKSTVPDLMAEICLFFCKNPSFDGIFVFGQ